MVLRDDLIKFINQLLRNDEYEDYCPNGLQIQGSNEINKILCGVSSSKIMIEKANEINADLLLVHHGFIWKGDLLRITDAIYDKVKLALESNLNIAAYHLPLDGHIDIGNASSLAKLLKLTSIKEEFYVSKKSVGIVAKNSDSTDHFIHLFKELINPNPIIILNKAIQNVGIVTGAGHSFFRQAIELGIDTFISGEGTEWVYHMANEFNVNFIAGGHHNTEKFGVQSLGRKISETFSVKIEYYDEKNPF